MKVEISPRLHPRRGGKVEVGNVYSNNTTRFFRVVVGIVDGRYRNRGKWNNVVCLHVDATGDIVGASCQPSKYMEGHQDLVGRVREMPVLRLEWFKEDEI